MSYAAALDHLHRLGQELAMPSQAELSTPLATPAPTARRKFDLDHMRVLAHALGDPQNRFPSILVAGTNGKGSTSATLAAILAAAGYRAALYTSPHLTRVNERIRTVPQIAPSPNAPAGLLEDIPDDDFARLYFQVDDAGQALVRESRLPHPPSYFEVLTMIAFLYFAEDRRGHPVDIAILEVGLGGRLDATNIVQPLVSVITDIALDHQEYLGDTITEIAAEKAGILRANGVLVTLPQHPEANQAVGEAAMRLNVRGVSAADYLPDQTHRSDPNHDVTPQQAAATGSPLRLNRYRVMVDGEPLEVRSPLAGRHQQRNVALAIATAQELRINHGYKITKAAIENGIANTHWPGRLEFLPPNLLLDVAHNPAGAWTLRAALADLPEAQPRTLIFSCLRDKDLREMAQILFPLFDSTGGRPADHIILAPIDNARAQSLDALKSAAEAMDVPAHAVADIPAALQLAREITPEGGLILATGSLYLVGAIRGLVLGE